MSLIAQALALGARPRLRISLRETDDPEGDIARAWPLFCLLASRPGRDAVLVTIHTLDGARRQVVFPCQVDRDLLTAVAQVLRQANRDRR